MQPNPLKPRRLFQVMLISGVIAAAGSSSAQQTPPAPKQTPAAASTSVSTTSTTAPLSRKEFNERKKQLQKAKQVNKWPTRIRTQPGQFAIDLTVTECIWLGGRVEYWEDCGTTLMMCVGANGRATCITEIK